MTRSAYASSFLAVRLLCPLVRDPLREQRRDVGALGRQRSVVDRWDDAVGERPRGRLAATRLFEGRLQVLDRVRQLDAAGQDGELRHRGEPREPRQRAVDLYDAGA